MLFTLTDHAQVRCQQRGVSYEVIALIQRYGIEQHAGGGLVRVWIDRAAHEDIINELGEAAIPLLEKAGHFYLIMGDGNSIITVAPTKERFWDKPRNPGKQHQRHVARCAAGRPWPKAPR